MVDGDSARLIATALNGAAGGDVTGSLGGLVQASAVNVLQGLAATQVKDQVDLIADPRRREVTRTALQAVIGCGGAAAGGSGGCGSAAAGAAPAVGDFLRGGAAEGAGSLAGQTYDYFAGTRERLDFGAVGTSGLIGGAGSVIGGAVVDHTGPLRINGLTAGRNNWGAVYQGRLTARSNGYVYNISSPVSARGSVANSISDLPSFVGGNTAQAYLGNHLNAVRACAGDKTKC